MIIKETPDNITMKNPFNGETIETYNRAKQISENAFVAFSRIGQFWAWQLFEFDTPIENGISAPKSGRSRVVDPNGFIFGDEVVKIEVEV